MKLRHTVLAAALVAFSAPAFAVGDDAVIFSEWDMYNSIYVTGDIFAEGTIQVRSESAALVDQDQFTVANWSLGDGDQEAFAEDGALENASGNIGLNIAAGVGNAQANDTALASIDGRRVFASAMVFSSQTTDSNLGTDTPSGPHNELFYDAYLTDSVLAGASGNIGVNVAAGAGNAQGNGMAASVNSSGTIAKASADSEQQTLANTIEVGIDLDNTAYLSGSALAGAVGNIGVNIAAGVGNAQHNGLAIAVASCGTCGP